MEKGSIIPVPANPPHTDAQHATDAFTEYPLGHWHGSVAHSFCASQQSHPVVPSEHVHRKLLLRVHALRVRSISSTTALMTASLAPPFSFSPPYVTRRKCFTTARRAWVPHVNGGTSSRLMPSRFVSLSPEHGSSNRREALPSVLLDQMTFSTLSGPGVSVMDPIGPCMTQSAY